MDLFRNLILPEEIIDEEIPEPTANTVEEELDEGEWDRIRGKRGQGGAGAGSTSNVRIVAEVFESKI